MISIRKPKMSNGWMSNYTNVKANHVCCVIENDATTALLHIGTKIIKIFNKLKTNFDFVLFYLFKRLLLSHSSNCILENKKMNYLYKIHCYQRLIPSCYR